MLTNVKKSPFFWETFKNWLISSAKINVAINVSMKTLHWIIKCVVLGVYAREREENCSILRALLEWDLMALSYPLIKLSLDNWRRLADWKVENVPNRAWGNLLVPRWSLGWNLPWLCNTVWEFGMLWTLNSSKKKIVEISWNLLYFVDTMNKIQSSIVEFRKFLSTRLFFGVSIFFWAPLCCQQKTATFWSAKA